jgi:alpha-tubulin suppressor-like RCC1 family protein
VWGVGYHAYGNIGDGATATFYARPALARPPLNESPLQEATDVACGGNFTIALKSDRTAWTWGGNYNGQLGAGLPMENADVFTRFPVQVKGAGGSGSLTNITRIAAGTYHVLALRTDGSVWTWGYNNFGQLGDGTATNRGVYNGATLSLCWLREKKNRATRLVRVARSF